MDLVDDDNRHRGTSRLALLKESPARETARAIYSRAFFKHVLTMGPCGLGARVLDVGCGLGELSYYLDSLGLEVTGLDCDEQNIELAQLLNPHVHFEFGSSPREQFRDHNPSFDLIFARSIGAFGNGDWSRPTLLTLASLVTCLRPTGSIVVELQGCDFDLNNAALSENIQAISLLSIEIRHSLMEFDGITFTRMQIA